MVLASQAYAYRTPFIFIEARMTAQCYVDIILRPVVVLSVRLHNVTIQQDNVRAYVARLRMVSLHQNDIDVMRLPPTGYRIPVGHLHKSLSSRPQPPSSLRIFRIAITQRSNAIF